MSESLHIVCPHCDAVNRIPTGRLGHGPKCGKCHRPLFSGHPLLQPTRTSPSLVGKSR
jgi:thioredoxin 2